MLASSLSFSILDIIASSPSLLIIESVGYLPCSLPLPAANETRRIDPKTEIAQTTEKTPNSEKSVNLPSITAMDVTPKRQRMNPESSLLILEAGESLA